MNTTEMRKAFIIDIKNVYEQLSEQDKMEYRWEMLNLDKMDAYSLDNTLEMLSNRLDK